ncbi:hypothetical protein M5K25_003011 [Dendrobium thyrsiflorum]|uniref:Expansin-like EG45 domain-containing protein n=1 Tax=Dendrobium thyrsiflorum TaxID=117978 RepID=A0ABD0VPQ4_DENTH
MATDLSLTNINNSHWKTISLSNMKEETIIFAVPMLLFLASIGAETSGQASYYAEPYRPSACNWNNDYGTYITSVSDALWDNRNACGRNYVVWCTPFSHEGIFQNCIDGLSRYVVTVVDYCGHCNNSTMLLSQEIFSALTNTEKGQIEILYEEF